MRSYEDTPDSYAARSFETERAARNGYRPGWIWIPLAATLLLIILVIASGFIFGGYNDRTRGYDNGTAIEQSGGEMTMPSLATPVANPGAPEDGAAPLPERPLVRPEEAPPLANDGQ